MSRLKRVAGDANIGVICAKPGCNQQINAGGGQYCKNHKIESMRKYRQDNVYVSIIFLQAVYRHLPPAHQAYVDKVLKKREAKTPA